MRKFIALDLDGTTLNRQGELTEKTKKVVQKLRDLGHVVVLATGRPFSGAYPKYQELNLDTPLITDNGGSIENPTDKTFPRQKTYIPLDMMHAIFRHAKPYTITSFFSIDDMTYAYNYDPKLEAFFSGIHSDKIIEGDHTEFLVESTGLVYIIEPSYMQDFESYIQETFGNVLSHRLWGVENNTAVYEVYFKHISKSSALKYLLEYYDINPKDWIALGDGINDVEMIRDANHGVAMLNACPEVKAVARDITKYAHDEEGVARFLMHYFDFTL
jgi:5-amino-6-(5-phospho-D-ribitylamino)uracil phosphatase